MKILRIIILLLMCLQISACKKDERSVVTSNETETPNSDAMKIKITIGSKVYTCTLLDNETTRAFKLQLPLTLDMIELNGNEKYFDLGQGLPTKASNPGKIMNGDLMLYGSKTLVLFYKEFSTSYSYTRLGKIDDPQGLAAALGENNITVKFELQHQ